MKKRRRKEERKTCGAFYTDWEDERERGDQKACTGTRGEGSQRAEAMRRIGDGEHHSLYSIRSFQSILFVVTLESAYVQIWRACWSW